MIAEAGLKDFQPAPQVCDYWAVELLNVARGWGKSYEDQVEEGNQRVSDSEQRSRLSAEARVRLERLTALKLSRSRTLDQLERARHQAHREVLLKGLQAVEKEIEEIEEISKE